MKKITVRNIFDQAYDLILQQIKVMQNSNEIKLPAEPELAKKIGVSRVTIRRVLDKMARERLIDRQKGRGTFIRSASKTKTYTLLYENHVGLFRSWISAILLGLSMESESLNLKLEMQCLPDHKDIDLVNQLINHVRSHQSDGYILVAPNKLSKQDCLQMRQANIPLVSLMVDYDSPEIPAILSNHEQMGITAVNYLLEKNCQHIALITGPIGGGTIRKADTILQSIQQILGDKSPITGEKHSVTDRSVEQACLATKKIMALKCPPDAIITTENAASVGVLRALQQSRLDPSQWPLVLSYITPNNILHETLPWPFIESPSPTDLGKQAIHMLNRLMQGETLQTPVQLFNPSKLFQPLYL